MSSSPSHGNRNRQGRKGGRSREEKSGIKEGAAPPSPTAFAAAGLAWIVPGAGHVLLKRWGRGLLFFALVALALVLGCWLDGRLYWGWGGSPLRTLKSLGAMGSGAAYFVLRYGLGFAGDIRAPGFEYGSAFILSAGLMNLLLVLDAWDIALGRKE